MNAVRIFAKDLSVCEVCRNVFEADPSFSRWGTFCLEHRQAPMARDLLKDAVIAWANENWEQLAGTLSEQPEFAAMYAAYTGSGGQQALLIAPVTKPVE